MSSPSSSHGRRGSERRRAGGWAPMRSLSSVATTLWPAVRSARAARSAGSAWTTQRPTPRSRGRGPYVCEAEGADPHGATGGVVVQRVQPERENDRKERSDPGPIFAGRGRLACRHATGRARRQSLHPQGRVGIPGVPPRYSQIRVGPRQGRATTRTNHPPNCRIPVRPSRWLGQAHTPHQVPSPLGENHRPV